MPAARRRDAALVPPAPWERYELRESDVGRQDGGGGPGRDDCEGTDARLVIAAASDYDEAA